MNIGELVGYIRADDSKWGPPIRRAKGDLDDLAILSNRRLSTVADAVGDMGATAAKATISLLKAGVAVAAIGASVPALGAVASAIGAIGSAAAFLPAFIAVGVASMLALKLATVGVGDAMKAAAEGDAAALEEAIADLAPQAQAFVREFAALKGPFDELRHQVQDALFKDLGQELKALGQAYLPAVGGELSSVAGGFNIAARSVADFLANSATVQDVRTVLGSAGGAAGSLASALQPLAQIILDLAVTGSEFLGGFTSGLGEAAQQAAAMVRAARESGELKQFFVDAASAVGDLWQILKNVGSIIGGVFSAGEEAGGGLLENLKQITGAIAQMVNSVEGQAALSGFFGGASQIIGALLPLILTLAKVIGTTVAPAIAQFVTAMGPGLTAVVDAVAESVGILAPALGPVGEAFSAVLVALAPLLPVLAEVAVVLAEELARAIVELAPHLPDLVTALGDILIALVPLLPTLVDLAIAFLPLIDNATKTATVIADVIDAIVPFIQWWLRLATTLYTDVVGALVAFGDWMMGTKDRVLGAVDALSAIPGKVDGFFDRMVDAAVERGSELVSWVSGLPGRILGAIGSLGSLLYQAGRNVVQGLINGIRDMLGRLADVASSVAQTIRDRLPFSPAKAGPLRDFPPDKAGSKIVQMLAAGMLGERGTLGSAMDQLMQLGSPDPLAALRTAGSRSAAMGGGGRLRITFDTNGGGDELMTMLQRRIRIDYDGDPAAAFAG